MDILITENKSTGKLNPVNNAVRVFIDGDMDYGYWVSEHDLFEMLTEDQRHLYLKGNHANGDVALIDVDVEVARKLIEIGMTPYKKKKFS